MLHSALKNAAETIYWLKLLRDSEHLDAAELTGLIKDCNHLINELLLTKEEMQF